MSDVKCPVCGGEAMAVYGRDNQIMCRGKCFRTIQIGGEPVAQLAPALAAVTKPGPIQRPICDHPSFQSEVTVYRVAHEQGMPASGLSAGVRVKCTACGEQFRFGGLVSSDHPYGPRISYDGHEVRIPVLPDWPTIERLELGPISEADIARGDALDVPE